MSAYEFRCPFGLVFDADRLLCEWPWLVPRCGSGVAVATETFYGGALDQYDGLGVLGVTRLGGLHGPIQQPTAKVYTNVGTTGTGIGAGTIGLSPVVEANTVGGYATPTVGVTGNAIGGYTNVGTVGVGVNTLGGYATPTVGVTGNAIGGYTNVGTVGVGVNTGYAVPTAGYTGTAIGDNRLYANVGTAGGVGGFIGVAPSVGISAGGNQFGTTAYGQRIAGYGLGAAQYNSGSYQFGGLSSKAAESLQNAGLIRNLQTSSIGHQYGYARGNNGFQYNTGTIGIGSTNPHLVNGLAFDGNFGAKSQQSFTQYHGQQDNGIAGNINIIGGGYSAVGLSDIEVTNNGADSNTITSVTPSPISVTTISSVPTVTANPTASIPVVTSVPVPALKVASGFQSYQGGVVANVPELQYKVVRPSPIANISTNFVNIVSTTPTNLVGFSSPSISLVQEPVKIQGGSYSYQQVDTVRQGYSYPKPAIAFEEVRSTVQTPVVQQTVIQPTVQTVVQPAVFKQEIFQGYKYARPSIAFEEIPQVSTVKPILFQPAVQKTVVQKTTLPAAVSVQSIQKQFQGYNYPKPSIAFEKVPVVSSTVRPQIVVASTPITPIVPHVQPAAVSVSTFQKHEQFQGYDYPKPSVAFEEVPQIQPQIYVSSTAAPVQHVVQPIVQQKVQPAAVSISTFQKHNQFQGYEYAKPSIAFEEIPQVRVSTTVQPQIFVSSTPAPVIKQEIIQPVQKVIQPAAVSASTFQKHEAIQGYDYPKPSIAFEEVPQVRPQVYVSSTVAPIVQPVHPVIQKIQAVQPIIQNVTPVSVATFQKHEQFQGYDYPKPAVAFEEVPRPQVHVTSTVAPVIQQKLVQPSVLKVQPPISVSTFQKHEQFQGYDYPKPAVVFEEVPRPQVYVSSTVAPVIQQQKIIQPILHKAQPVQEQFQGYDYPKPAIAFEEVPQVSTVRPPVIVSSTVAPVVKTRVVQPAVVQNVGYYPKHSIPLEAKPAVSVSYHQPVVQKVAQPVAVQPVVQSYYYQKPAVSTYNYQNVIQKSVGYSYPKPAIAFEETPVAVKQPAVVSSYSYPVPSTTPRQIVQQPVIVQKQPAVISSYSYTAPSTTARPIAIEQQPVYSYAAPTVKPIVQQPVVTVQQPTVSTYSYPAPTIRPIAVQQPIVSTYNYPAPTVKPVVYRKPAVVSSYSYTAPAQKTAAVEFAGYDYPKPAVSFVEEPIYKDLEPVKEVPFVAKKAYVTGGQSYQFKQQQHIFQPINQQVYSQVDSGYVYDKPTVRFEDKPIVRVAISTPKIQPIAVTTPKPRPIVTERYQPLQPIIVESYEAPILKQKQVYSEINDGYIYEKPTVRFEENYQPRKPIRFNEQPIVVETVTPKTTVDYNYVQSTPKPTFATVINKVVPITQPFTFYDSRLSTTSRPSTKVVNIQTLTGTSRPIARYSFGALEETKEYLPPSTTPRVYLPPATTPREYLPPRRKIKITTTAVPVTTREYLPPPPPTKEYLPVAPTREYLPANRKAKVIVKANDFHPLLSAKLGAQCTCVSNTVKLRKKPQKIVVEEVEDDDNDGYEVDQNGGVIVENYEYEPQKVVDITPTPQVLIKSTSVPVVVRKKVRVRPVTTLAPPDYDLPVSQAAEIFVQKTQTPATSDHEIVKAVRTGLKLVKEAAKEGAKEGTNEVLSNKSFDRYGPGGWRSRNERLQGTIDCQREGLFRHPTQCNKFYACRWDCTKNRYTLHVFNCPVHLTFDKNLGACNWPSQGPACLENTLLPSD